MNQGSIYLIQHYLKLKIDTPFFSLENTDEILLNVIWVNLIFAAKYSAPACNKYGASVLRLASNKRSHSSLTARQPGLTP
jgi:hypothetical protein